MAWIARASDMFLVLVAALVLQSCAAGGATKGVASASDPNNGTVIARVSIQGFKYVNNYSVLVRRVGTADNAFSMQGWSMGSDGYWARYYDDIERGELVVMNVPAGEYELHGWWIGASGWGGVRTSNAPNRVSHRFRVEAGKAVYLGHIHLEVAGDSGMTPAAFQSGTYKARLVVRDSRARDLAQLPSGLSADRVEVRLLR